MRRNKTSICSLSLSLSLSLPLVLSLSLSFSITAEMSYLKWIVVLQLLNIPIVYAGMAAHNVLLNTDVLSEEPSDGGGPG